MLPYQIAFIPHLLWICMTVASYFLQLAILLKQHRLSGLKLADPLALSGMFSQYGYVALLRSFYVKSRSTLKPLMGISIQRINQDSLNNINWINNKEGIKD